MQRRRMRATMIGNEVEDGSDDGSKSQKRVIQTHTAHFMVEPCNDTM